MTFWHLKKNYLHLGQNFEKCCNLLKILRILDTLEHFWLSWPFDLLWILFLPFLQFWKLLKCTRNSENFGYIWAFLTFVTFLVFFKKNSLHLGQHFENCYYLLEILIILDIFKHFWLSWPFDLLSIFFLPFAYIWDKNLKIDEMYSKFWNFWIYLSIFDYRDLLAFKKNYLHLGQNFEKCSTLLEIQRILDILKHFWRSWPFGLLLIIFLPFDRHLWAFLAFVT